MSDQKLSMADLLAKAGSQVKVPKTGDIVNGKIISISKKQVLIDVGGKTEGVVADREFQMAAEFIAELKAGDAVEAYVLDADTERGQIMLSLKQAAQDKKWDELEAKQKAGDILTVIANEVNRGGVVAHVDGIRAFIPSSQFGRHMTKLPQLKGKEIQVKILEIDKDQARLILSERLVSEADELANSSLALQAIEEGSTVKGIITGIKPFGLFVAVEVPVKNEEGAESKGVLEGLVHVSEVSWEKIDDLNATFKKGQEIETKVLVVDKNQGKLTLSIRQLNGNPWDDLADKMPAGTIIRGKVSRVVPFGVFVAIAPGVDGLIHESKLAGNVYGEGDEVEVSVDSIDTAQQRVSLSPATTELPVTYK